MYASLAQGEGLGTGLGPVHVAGGAQNGDEDQEGEERKVDIIGLGLGPQRH